jgi:hypothetical protein
MLPDSENALKLICALVITLTGALWFMSFRCRQLKRVENANQNQRLKNLKNYMSPKAPYLLCSVHTTATRGLLFHRLVRCETAR